MIERGGVIGPAHDAVAQVHALPVPESTGCPTSWQEGPWAQGCRCFVRVEVGYIRRA
jgi:hypothetical protein